MKLEIVFYFVLFSAEVADERLDRHVSRCGVSLAVGRRGEILRALFALVLMNFGFVGLQFGAGFANDAASFAGIIVDFLPRMNPLEMARQSCLESEKWDSLQKSNNLLHKSYPVG